MFTYPSEINKWTIRGGPDPVSTSVQSVATCPETAVSQIWRQWITRDMKKHNRQIYVEFFLSIMQS